MDRAGITLKRAFLNLADMVFIVRRQGNIMKNIRRFFPRAALIIVGLALTMIGLYMGFEPAQVTISAVASLGHTAATTNVRVALGGFHLGSGLFFLLCAFRRDWILPGQTAAAIIIGCGLIFRLIGLEYDSAAHANFIPLERETFAFLLVIASFLVKDRATSH